MLPSTKVLPIIRRSKRFQPPVVLDNPKAVTLENAARWIIAQKAEKSQEAMTRLSQRGKWPVNDDEIYSYLGRTGSTRQFKSLKTFWGYNLKNPALYPRVWRHEPISLGSFDDLKSAADFAFRRSWQIATKHNRTFQYNRSFAYMYREEAGATPKALSTAETATIEDPTAELLVVNVTEYASSLEAHSFERVKNGGIMYQAAREAAKKYPQINVRFSYTNLDKLGLPLHHRYAVPFIRLSLRRGAVKSYFSRPGRNIRRRGSAYGRTSPHERAFHDFHRSMRGARSRSGLRRQDTRHFGDDLYSYQRFRSRIRRRR